MQPYIKYKSGYKYQIVEPYTIETGMKIGESIQTRYIKMHSDGLLFIERGYCFDGPSGPAIDTKNFMRGSLVHDALYQLMRMDLLPWAKWRNHADLLLRKICREDGMSAIRAWWVYKGLDWFARKASNPKNKKPIHVAP